MSDDTYEVYAVRYGHHDRRSPENFLGGDPHDILQPLDFYVWAIVGAGRTYNVGEVLEGYANLKRLAASRDHIVPGHDPQVLTRYPAPRSGLERWVVRLDADPKPA